MIKVNDKVTLFLPQEEIEPQALDQIMTISKMPVVTGISVMPDCHLGKGATVGSVIATEKYIIPSAVGVDIGCGMISVKTKLFKSDLEQQKVDLGKLREGIERRIPLGAGQFNKKITKSAHARIHKLLDGVSQERIDLFDKLSQSWTSAVGTLGSGNHFIEIALDETDQVWVLLHSGSRGIGNKIASHHIKIAQDVCSHKGIELPDKELAYLEMTTEFGLSYMEDLLWAQDFAKYNRDEMMDRVMTEISYALYGEEGHGEEIEMERINCHHNFTQKEVHNGITLYITRKGAIQANLGQKGMIPGSMGTRSYIVSGLANPDSYNSAPHGAGRRMSRNEAKKKFTLHDLEMDMGNIEFRHSANLVDEHPLAYKDIDRVMENSKELVKVEHTLRQILNVKGD